MNFEPKSTFRDSGDNIQRAILRGEGCIEREEHSFSFLLQNICTWFFMSFHILLLFLLLSRHPALVSFSASREQRTLTYPEIPFFLTVKSSVSPGNTAARAGGPPADAAGKGTH